MALVPETGSGSATADSYVTLVEADAYFTAHGSPSAWTALTDANKESALRYAAKWIDARYRWAGQRLYSTQALSFPRTSFVTNDDRYFASATIPSDLQALQCEAALKHVEGALNASYSRGGALTGLQVDVIRLDYAEGAGIENAEPYLDALAKPFILSGPGMLRAVLG